MSEEVGLDPKQSTPAAAERPGGDRAVQDVSAWVLRTGVVSSVGVMLLGMGLTFFHHPPSVAEMTGAAGRATYGLAEIAHGIAHGDGKSLVELGVLMLVLTPVVRVALSAVIFAVEERDFRYAGITLVVLAMTLFSLFALG